GISGSANLTYSGLNKNVESLSIAETNEEIEQIETDFMRIWMFYERKGMSKDELSNETSYSIRKALPVLHNFGNANNDNIRSKELVYHPYYFFEFIFRGSVRSPPLLFEDSGFLLVDGISRQIITNELLASEISSYSIEDYFLKTEDKYQVRMNPSKIGD